MATKMLTGLTKRKYHYTDLLDDWLYYKSYLSERKLAPRTIISYKNLMNMHLKPLLGCFTLDKINRPKLIKEFLTEKSKTLSSQSLRNIYFMITSSLNYAVVYEDLETNKIKFMDTPPKNNTEKSTWDIETLKEVFFKKLIKSPIYIPSVIVLFTGMREAEVCGLQKEDVDLKNKILYVKYQLQCFSGGRYVLRQTKTHKAKKPILFGDTLANILQIHFDNQESMKYEYGDDYNRNQFVEFEAVRPRKLDFVCTWPDGKCFRADYVGKKWSKEVRSIVKERDREIEEGLYDFNPFDPPITFHEVRHSHASMLAEGDIDPKTIQERLRHSTANVTLNEYVHPKTNTQKKAVDYLEDKFSNKVKR
jgi:integrase